MTELSYSGNAPGSVGSVSGLNLAQSTGLLLSISRLIKSLHPLSPEILSVKSPKLVDLYQP